MSVAYYADRVDRGACPCCDRFRCQCGEVDIEAQGFQRIGKRKDGEIMYRRRDRYTGRCDVVTGEGAEKLLALEAERRRNG